MTAATNCENGGRDGQVVPEHRHDDAPASAQIPSPDLPASVVGADPGTHLRPADAKVASAARRYEISILIGPCSQQEAEDAMVTAHESVAHLGPGTALQFWNDDEDGGMPGGESVPGVEILG